MNVLARLLLASALAGVAASAAGALATETLPPGSVLLPDGTVAVPEIGEGPAWWTPEVREKALRAAELGMGYDFVEDELVDLTLAASTQVLLRPGSQIFPDSIFPGWCTAAFTFSSQAYISTAGHCTHYAGDPVFALAAPSTIFFFGSTSATTSLGPGNDWALIRITLSLPVDYVDSDVAFWKGPCGEVTTNLFSQVPSTLVQHVGHGTVSGTGGVPRVGLLTAISTNRADYIAETQGGDSGSPILLARPIASTQDEGVVGLCHNAALAIHTHTSCVPAIAICTKYGTRTTLVTGNPDNGNFLPV